jgi:fumarate reductase flavoprotein subunit
VVSEPSSFDVVVVGAGGAGLAAGVSAREHGAEVLVVEAGRQAGGSTALSGGAFLAGGTAVQRAAGYDDDSAQEFYDNFLAINRWDVEPSIVRRYCDDSAAAVDWLIGHGVEFLPEQLERGELERVPRLHRAAGGGAGIAAALHKACGRLGVEIAFGTRVDSLLMRDGRVAGIRAGDQELEAPAVVIASGGFAHNRSLLSQHVPSVASFVDEVRSPAAETNVGDGLRMAADAGAATGGENRAQLLLTSGIVTDLEPVLPPWLICVDRSGRRFVKESVPYHVINPLVVKHGGICWALFDEESCRAAMGSGSRFGAGLWNHDVLSRAADDGKIVRAARVEALAEQLGLPPLVVRSTVDRYNVDVDNGVDSLFFKNGATLRPMRTPPFYGVALRPRIMPVTGYGLRIDSDGQVLRESDNLPIPGLFAAGEVAGNVVGPSIFSGGAMVAGAVIFGRRAGAVAASLTAARAA